MSSEYKMDLNRLRKDELTFELLVRGIKVSPSEIVEGMRACLRPLLKLEQSSKPDYPDPKLIPKDQLAIVEQKLYELRGNVEKSDSSLSTIRSRAIHLLKRINCLSHYELSLEEEELKTILLTGILTLLDRLDNDPSAEIQEVVSAVIPQPVAVVNATEPEPVIIDPNVSQTHSCTPHYSKAVTQPIQKWNLKFTGDAKGLSVHNFLERVEELQVARNVTDQQLFNSAVDLFDGKALLWYRSNKIKCKDWKSLSDLLIHHFEPPDYRIRLFKDIMVRTQDPSESIIEYLACMFSIFKRYGEMPEDVQLDIVSRNLAPFYTTQLPVINSLQQLEDECLKLEVKKYRADHYVPPSRKRHDYVEPNFAFIATPAEATALAPVVQPDFAKLSTPVETMPSNTPRTIVCWNCSHLGHSIQECPSPRKLICYRCGKHDFTVRTCPVCNTNKPLNLLRRN